MLCFVARLLTGMFTASLHAWSACAPAWMSQLAIRSLVLRVGHRAPRWGWADRFVAKVRNQLFAHRKWLLPERLLASNPCERSWRCASMPGHTAAGASGAGRAQNPRLSCAFSSLSPSPSRISQERARCFGTASDQLVVAPNGM